MRGLLALFCLSITLFIVSSTNTDYEKSLEYTETQEPTQTQNVQEHHRSKRSPYDPIIPALLLGKSAFLLGSILGPQLLHRPYYHRRPNYHRSYGGYHGGGGHGGGGHGGGWGGWGWGK